MRRAGTLDKIDAFLCLNSFAGERLIGAGLPTHKVALKPNSIDIAGFKPAYDSAGYALYIGRLSAEKGLRVLIEAARRLPELPVWIAGSGPMEAELNEAAADLPNIR